MWNQFSLLDLPVVLPLLEHQQAQGFQGPPESLEDQQAQGLHDHPKEKNRYILSECILKQ